MNQFIRKRKEREAVVAQADPEVGQETGKEAKEKRNQRKRKIKRERRREDTAVVVRVMMIKSKQN